jgi:hypothetical protein
VEQAQQSLSSVSSVRGTETSRRQVEFPFESAIESLLGLVAHLERNLRHAGASPTNSFF